MAKKPQPQIHSGILMDNGEVFAEGDEDKLAHHFTKEQVELHTKRGTISNFPAKDGKGGAARKAGKPVPAFEPDEDEDGDSADSFSELGNTGDEERDPNSPTGFRQEGEGTADKAAEKAKAAAEKEAKSK